MLLALLGLLADRSLAARPDAQALVIVTETDGGFQFQVAEALTVNGKESVRLMAVPAPPAPAAGAAPSPPPVVLQPKEADHGLQLSLAQVSFLRKSEDGMLYSLDPTTNTWLRAVPESLPQKVAENLSSIWARTPIAFATDRKSKSFTPVPYERLFAIVAGPTPAEALSSVFTTPLRWAVPGTDPSKRFDKRMGYLASFVKAYPNDSDKVRANLTDILKNYAESAAKGTAAYAALTNALRYVTVSESVFPADADQQKLCAALRQSKLAIDQRAAVLTALASGGLWDPFLTKYRALEPYETAFKPLAQLKKQALETSAAEHVQQARKLDSAGDFAGAVAQYKLALKRNPGDSSASEGLETVRIEATRGAARERLASHPPRDPSSPAQVEVQRHLDLARRFIADQQFGDADGELKLATQADATAPGIVLAQARILVMRSDLRGALAALDRYDAVANTEQEFSEGETLRRQVLYDLKKSQDSAHKQMKGLFDGQAFAKTLETANRGLQMDSEDTESLYYSGLAAAVLRQSKDAKRLLTAFLDNSDNLRADDKERTNARFVLRLLDEPPPTSVGRPHWFSAWNVADDVFYCPVSLMFSNRIATIKGSKLTVNFQWNGTQLQSVHSVWEDRHGFANAMSAIAGGLAAYGGTPTEVTTLGADRREGDFYFEYYKDFPQVLRVNAEHSFVSGGEEVMSVYTQKTGNTNGSPGITTAQTQVVRQDDGTSSTSGNSSFVTLLNNPRLDPILAARITPTRIAQGFAPNPYFHPLAWDSIYLFEYLYDGSGKVIYAWCKNPPGNIPRGARYEFSWEGDKLQKITLRAESKSDAAILYERTLSYSGHKLMAENINFGGKHPRIEYKYLGDKLVEASSDADPSLKGAAFHATFQQ